MPTLKRVYIAGPMTGIPFYNFPSFDFTAELGRELGYEIVSPAESDRAMGFDEHHEAPTQAELRLMIINDVIALTKCDAIALLPGWGYSTGVAVELAVARFLNLPVLDAQTFEPMRIREDL